MILSILALFPLLFRFALAHDSEGKTIADFDNDWATFHLAEEHHVDNFDAGAFFTLHDFDGNDAWSPTDVRRMYGLEDESNRNIDTERREEVTRNVFALYDENHDGIIERREFLSKTEDGVRLPDFGLGPGHHGDDEYEYEIHHFEKYHDENTRPEDLIHPEDIEHFAKHEKEDAEEERWELLNQNSIVEANIPEMFRRRTEL